MSKITGNQKRPQIKHLKGVSLQELESLRTKTKIYFETKELLNLQPDYQRTEQQTADQLYKILSEIEYVYIENENDIKIKLDYIWRILNRLYKFIWSKSPRPNKVEFQAMMKPYNNFINFIVNEEIFNKIFEITNKDYPIYNAWWVKYQENDSNDDEDNNNNENENNKLYNKQTFTNLSQNFQQSNYYKLQMNDRLYLHSNPKDFDGIVFQIDIINKNKVEKQIASQNQTLNGNGDENQSIVVDEYGNFSQQNQNGEGNDSLNNSVKSLQNFQSQNQSVHSQNNFKKDTSNYEIKKNKRSKVNIESLEQL